MVDIQRLSLSIPKKINNKTKERIQKGPNFFCTDLSVATDEQIREWRRRSYTRLHFNFRPSFCLCDQLNVSLPNKHEKCTLHSLCRYLPQLTILVSSCNGISVSLHSKPFHSLLEIPMTTKVARTKTYPVFSKCENVNENAKENKEAFICRSYFPTMSKESNFLIYD